MEWRGQRESDNIEDRRGGLPLGRTAVVGGGLGTVVLAVVYALLGGDPRDVLEGIQQQPPRAGADVPATPYQEAPAEGEARRFVAVVLAETEDVWHAEFQRRGAEYADPRLVLYRREVESACGAAAAAMGPFYCPGDRRVYLDLSFFDELSRRFGAPGEFARAYVVAHEVGHHVQNLLGISARVRAAEERGDPAHANQLSVRLELQADCLAGVWANRSQRALKIDATDIDSALGAASAVGDDRLQRAARGYVVPDSFTHGTSEQRMRWFRRGVEAGALGACDTFRSRDL
ncbi:MAG: neutral zinc metallopeptidase [Proteobacteria bacterium]|nr:neutral zinc metallopeptidase [Pseudomonadota bacterium]